MQILEVVALHLLFAALGFCQASKSAAARHPGYASLNKAGIPSADATDGVERPVLGERLHTVYCKPALTRHAFHSQSLESRVWHAVTSFTVHGRLGIYMKLKFHEEALDGCKPYRIWAIARQCLVDNQGQSRMNCIAWL